MCIAIDLTRVDDKLSAAYDTTTLEKTIESHLLFLQELVQATFYNTRGIHLQSFINDSPLVLT